MNHSDKLPETLRPKSSAGATPAATAPGALRKHLPAAVLLALAAGLAFIFRQLGRQPDLKARVPEFIALMLVAGVLYLIAAYLVQQFRIGLPSLLIILPAAVAFRLFVFPLEPQLSDDVYRYQWEGRIQRARLNPYTVYPALPNLRRFQDPAHPLETGRDTPTVYPPLSERAFAWIETAKAYKRLFTALDLASVGVLLMILAALNQPAEHVLIYAWNPTVAVSFAMCGHHDSLAVFTLLLATLSIITRREALSAAFLALSVLSKFFAILLLPVFLKSLRHAPQTELSAASPPAGDRYASRPRQMAGSPLHDRRLVFCSIFAGVVILGYLPYLGAGRRIFRGLGNYAAVWEANDSLFRLIRYAGNSQSQAELVTGVLMLVLLAYALKGVPKPVAPRAQELLDQSEPQARPATFVRNPESESENLPDRRAYILKAGLLLTAGLLLLSPDAFPWYFTWSIPFLCFYPSAPWLLMSVTAVLGYAPVVGYAAGQPYLHSPFILALEYAPVLAWLAWLGARRVR